MFTEQRSHVIRVNEFIAMPESPVDPIQVSLSINKLNLTPLGHRSLELPGYVNLNVKGYFLSPVHVFGARAVEEVQRSIKHIRAQGNFDGKATMDDLTYEIEVSNILKKHTPTAYFDKNFPIWKVVGYSYTDQLITLWRDDKDVQVPGILIYRHFPNTQYRLADFFMEGAEDVTRLELLKLQSQWNLTTEGVFLKAISKLASAFNALNSSNLIHGNLYWRGNYRGKIYGRPNLHNTAPDGSFGDFEMPDCKYGQNNKETRQRELLGGFVSYLLMIAKVNPQVLDGTFISNFVDTFVSSLSFDLVLGLKERPLKSVRLEMQNRFEMSSQGITTKNGIEFFNDSFFASVGDKILSALDVLSKKL